MAKKNTIIGELKGVDFKLGVTFFSLSNEDVVKIYKDIVLPDLERNNIHPNQFMNPYTPNMCISLNLGLVSKNKWFSKSKILKNSENRFGLSLGNHSGGIIMCDVAFPNDTATSLINGVIKYIGYGINFDYTVNSKPILKDFALYSSLGGAVVLHNYKAAKTDAPLFKRNSPTIGSNIELVNTQTSMTSVDLKMILGLKYNLSCDFNWFGELAFGGSYYPKGLSKKNTILSFGQIALIGIRYKFIKPEEKTRNKANVFW